METLLVFKPELLPVGYNSEIASVNHLPELEELSVSAEMLLDGLKDCQKLRQVTIIGDSPRPPEFSDRLEIESQEDNPSGITIQLRNR